MSNFKPRKFFFNILINKPVGKTTKKKIIPNTNGEIILPSNIPNLIHSLFNGVSEFEFINPKIKNINETIIAQILIPSWFINGYKPIIKTNIAQDPEWAKALFYFECFNIIDSANANACRIHVFGSKGKCLFLIMNL